MKESEPKTKFLFSYDELSHLSLTALSLADRDQVELAAYGVDAAYIAKLAGKHQELIDFPSDSELFGDAINCTEIKNSLADKVKTGVNSVMVRARSVFAEDSGKWMLFGFRGMSGMSDLELAKCGYRVVRRANEFLVELTPKGVTQEMIDALREDLIDFDKAFDAQQDATYMRLCVTRDRIKLGNELYAMIVELFNFGKDYWLSHDESKHGAYIIYNTPSGKQPDDEKSEGVVEDK